jgi:hypothetical protein
MSRAAEDQRRPSSIRVDGDVGLGEAVLEMVSIMASRDRTCRAAGLGVGPGSILSEVAT